MPGERTTLPSAEHNQIQQLNRVLQLGPLALIGPGDERVDLPDSVCRILKDAVKNMSTGAATRAVPRERRLTTQSAADLLGFSRPYLIKLLDSGTIPFEKVGRHRRLRLRDVLAFQKKRDAARRAGLNELARAEFEEGQYAGLPIPENGSDG